jgi:hypothetical protein
MAENIQCPHSSREEKKPLEGSVAVDPSRNLVLGEIFRERLGEHVIALCALVGTAPESRASEHNLNSHTWFYGIASVVAFLLLSCSASTSGMIWASLCCYSQYLRASAVLANDLLADGSNRRLV